MNYPWQNIFYIDPKGKTIPYQAAPDTDTKTGFMDLKTQPEVIAALPECRKLPAFTQYLTAINGADTGVFSIGCHFAQHSVAQGCKATGYLEFAFNDQALVQDPNHYFAQYFQFHNRLVRARFAHAIGFEWVLLPAVFSPADQQGFSCSVKMNSLEPSDQPASVNQWLMALELLTEHLVDIESTCSEPIYCRKKGE